MIEIGRGLVLLAVVFALAVPGGGALRPVRNGCDWTPGLLPLPADRVDGRVTAGEGVWLAGVATAYDVPREGVLWRDGRLTALGPAFGMDTMLHAVNADGVAVGAVTDGSRHAVRYRSGRYEYLPESAGRSVAFDVNAGGAVVGLDGAALVVWAADGTTRALALPPGAAPYGRPVLDDDGTVVARTGTPEGSAMRWRVFVWTPEGARIPLAAGEVRDLRDGRVVGGDGVATGWSLDGLARVYRGGVSAVAVNGDGVVVGAGGNGEPLLWSGAVPTELPAPPGYVAGSVHAVNDREAGGFVSPVDDVGAVPVRWTCR